jgi:methionine-rich copper-binding protein CopC
VVSADAWRLAVLLGLSAVWLLASSTPALAHARLLQSYPANGDTVAEPPEQVQLRFSESVEAAFEPIEVYADGGNRVDKNDAQTAPDNPKVLLTDLEELSEGSYTVDWRVTSADGHPVSNSFRFAVDASAPNAEPGAGEPIVPIEHSATQEAGGSAWSSIQAVVLGLLLIGALAVARIVALRRR